MHIALSCPSWPATSARNGIVTYVATMEQELRAIGYTTSVFTGRFLEQSELASNVVETSSAPGFCERLAGRLPFGKDRVQARKLRRAALTMCDFLNSKSKNLRVDLLEVHDGFGSAAVVAPRVSIPVVVRLHGPFFLTGPANGTPQDDSFRKRVELEGKALEKAAAITAPSKAVMNATLEYYGLTKSHAQVIPNPIQIGPVSQQWRIQDAMPESILFVGRFDRLKGGDIALLAFKEVLNRYPMAKLFFVGPDHGIQVSNNQRIGFREFVQQRMPSAANRIEFLGQRSPREIGVYRKQAALTVVASRYETFSYTTLESMEKGCPTIATKLDAISEMVSHEQTGLLVQPECPRSLAEAICRLFKNPHFAAQLGASAARDASKRFSSRTVAEQCISFYRSVLQRGSYLL